MTKLGVLLILAVASAALGALALAVVTPERPNDSDDTPERASDEPPGDAH